MKRIKFYIEHVDANLLRSINGRSGQLIKLIRSGKYTDEELLAAKLYNGKWEHQNYINLKNRTRKILEAYFLMNPTKEGYEALNKLQECRKSYLLALHFLEVSKRDEARKMLMKSYKIATEYGFTLWAYSCAIELAADASVRRSPLTKFELYCQKSDEFLRDLQAENAARQGFRKMALYANKKRGVYEDVYTKCIAHLNSFSCTSIRFIEIYYMIRTLKTVNDMDYVAIVKDMEVALNLLRNRKGVYRSTLQFFTKNKAFAHIALQEYSEAEKLLLESIAYAPPYSYNRGILYYYLAVNFLHSGDYQKAYELYRQHRKVDSEELAEQWAVMGAYLYFLKKTGHLKVGDDRFSIGKYLNDTVNTIHDKTGNNINVLIGELLMYLIKNRGKFIDRVEAVKNYSYTYLKGKDTQRARWFIKILYTMVRADFNAGTLERMAAKQFENLEKFPVGMGYNMSIEIIPFLPLWRIIAQELSKKAA